MLIRFCCPMNFDVLYLDENDEQIAVPHTFDGDYEVEKVKLKRGEPQFGHTLFMVNGDQKGLQDGGIFEVPNPAWDEVKV